MLTKSKLDNLISQFTDAIHGQWKIRKNNYVIALTVETTVAINYKYTMDLNKSTNERMMNNRRITNNEQ